MPRVTRQIVHTFPGQGDFAVSPLVRAVREHVPVRMAVAETFAEVDRAGAESGIPPLGPALLSERPPTGRDLAHGPVGSSQLALFGASMAVHRTLCGVGLRADRLVGVSFGEIAALTAAGVFEVADGARIACRLAQCLSSCEGGMTLLAGGESSARSLLREVGSPHLVIACVNDPEETVLSGPVPLLERVEQAAADAGVPTARLKLPFLSHHPSLSQAADTFAAAVREVPHHPARLPVHSAVLGRAYTASDDFAAGLSACLTDPVRLPGVLDGAAVSASTLFLEAGTGSALTHSTRRALGPGRAEAHAPLATPDFPWGDEATRRRWRAGDTQKPHLPRS
ncbi:acyltransferase domain-containing protein [Streptomyces sp. NPDC054796]